MIQHATGQSLTARFKAGWHTARILAEHVIFPPYCVLCFKAANAQTSMCSSCFEELCFISEPCCDQCGIPFEYASIDKRCIPCQDNPPPYDAARALWQYDDVSSRLVTRLKYSDATHLAPYLASMMVRLLDADMRKADAIIPIPLHRYRLLKRKYNQSALLASRIAKAVPTVPYKHHLLIRHHYTPPQVTLNYEQRRGNVKDVFSVSSRYAEWLQDKHIIVVDDVLTTGATVESAAATLKECGAARVSVILCAKRII